MDESICNSCGGLVKGFYEGRCEDCFALDMTEHLGSGHLSFATNHALGRSHVQRLSQLNPKEKSE